MLIDIYGDEMANRLSNTEVRLAMGAIFCITQLDLNVMNEKNRDEFLLFIEGIHLDSELMQVS